MSSSARVAVRVLASPPAGTARSRSRRDRRGPRRRCGRWLGVRFYLEVPSSRVRHAGFVVSSGGILSFASLRTGLRGSRVSGRDELHGILRRPCGPPQDDSLPCHSERGGAERGILCFADAFGGTAHDHAVLAAASRTRAMNTASIPPAIAASRAFFAPPRGSGVSGGTAGAPRRMSSMFCSPFASRAWL